MRERVEINTGTQSTCLVGCAIMTHTGQYPPDVTSCLTGLSGCICPHEAPAGYGLCFLQLLRKCFASVRDWLIELKRVHRLFNRAVTAARP